MKLGNTTIISFINLKGGVGKTTSAVNVAATLAKRTFKSGSQTQKPASVLLIDLDPQSNASLTLLKKNDYEERNEENKTLYKLFEHEISRNDESETFDLDEIRVHIEDMSLDLLPSSLKLIDIQDELVGYHRYYLSPTDILFNALTKLRNDRYNKTYTHIICDCPPSLGLITLNALSLSNYYIVPTLLDAYSYWGLDKIFDRVQRLKRCKASCKVELLGVFYSKVNGRTTNENEKWKLAFQTWQSQYNVSESQKPLIFDSEISEADVIRKAESDNSPLITYTPNDSHSKSARRKCQREWDNLVDEILNRIKTKKLSKT